MTQTLYAQRHSNRNNNNLQLKLPGLASNKNSMNRTIDENSRLTPEMMSNVPKKWG